MRWKLVDKGSKILDFKDMLESTCEIEHCGFDISVDQKS